MVVYVMRIGVSLLVIIVRLFWETSDVASFAH